MATQIEWTDENPETERPRAAQIIRAVGVLQMKDLVGYDIQVEADADAAFGERYTLKVEVAVEVTRAQVVAIMTPNDLQLIRAADVVAWPSSLVREYRRQYDQKMRLPHPPLLIHPDHAEQLWTAANGPLPERTN